MDVERAMCGVRRLRHEWFGFDGNKFYLHFAILLLSELVQHRLCEVVSAWSVGLESFKRGLPAVIDFANLFLII